MKILDVYESIVSDILSGDMPDDDVLLCMVALHTHSVVVAPHVNLEDMHQTPGQAVVLSPLTRRHVAECVAARWESNDPRGGSDYWYSLYDHLTPYEVFEDVPPGRRDRALDIKGLIAQHPLVAELLEE